LAHQPLGYTHPGHIMHDVSPLAQIGLGSRISRRGKTWIWSDAWGTAGAFL